MARCRLCSSCQDTTVILFTLCWLQGQVSPVHWPQLFKYPQLLLGASFQIKVTFTCAPKYTLPNSDSARPKQNKQKNTIISFIKSIKSKRTIFNTFYPNKTPQQCKLGERKALLLKKQSLLTVVLVFSQLSSHAPWVAGNSGHFYCSARSTSLLRKKHTQEKAFP